MPDLDGQVALVIGGTHGLGRSIAAAVASAGARVAVAGRHGDRSAAVAAWLGERSGRDCLGLRCDVRVEEDVDAVVATALDRWGRIDMLVNSAGNHIRGPIERVSRADLDASLAVHVVGTWLACRAVAGPMKRAGYGRVLNMASALGLAGGAERALYAAAKGAVVQITRSLALEWARTGITVNALAPGAFDTRMNAEVAGDARSRDRVPMGRWGEPDEVQEAALFLLSPRSSYVTGAILPVDGGATA